MECWNASEAKRPKPGDPLDKNRCASACEGLHNRDESITLVRRFPSLGGAIMALRIYPNGPFLSYDNRMTKDDAASQRTDLISQD